MNKVSDARPARLRRPVVAAVVAAGLLLSMACTHAAQVIQTRAYDYSPTTGQLIKEVVEPGNSKLCLVSAYVYDSFGNKKQSTQRNCNGSGGTFPGATTTEAAAPTANAIASRVSTTAYTYNPDGSVTVVSTNAMGAVQTNVYSGAHGALLSQNGPNILKDASGNVVNSQWAYDGFGRKVLERLPDGTGTRLGYAMCSVAACAFVGPVAPVYVVTSTPVAPPIDLVAKTTGAPNGPCAKTYYDALDRPIRTETQGSDVSGASTLVYQDTTYDARGRIRSTTAPYYSNDPATAALTTYTYDNWDRVILMVAADGSKTSTVYAGLVTSVTNDLGQLTKKRRDALGKVVEVVDAKNKSLLMGYDPVGNLLVTTDSAANVVAMHYDVRGNKIDMQDPDLGSWAYEYDAAGNLTKQTDAKAQVTTMSYDKLNRMRTRNEPTQNAAWGYDTCAQGIGQLCSATTSTGYERKPGYDRLGRVVSDTVKVGASTFLSNVDYDPRTGHVLNVRYPSFLPLRNVYTPLGFLQKVVNATTGATYWQANATDARGNLTQQTYGNGVGILNTYDALTGRLRATTAGAGAAVQNIAYTYDTLGNLKTRVDAKTGVSASYTHDPLNRIGSETRSGGGLPSAQTITWGYNDIGNITSRSDVGTYAYNPSGANSVRPHAVASIAGTVNGETNPSYTYDADGNLTAVTAGGGSHTVGWSSFNKVNSVSRTFGGHTNKLDYLYDAGQERVREVYTRDGTVQRTTTYLNPSQGAGLFYEEENGVAGVKKKHYLNAGGQTIGMVISNSSNTPVSTQYWHKDHLGSLMVVTDANGAVSERLAYEPFGKRRNANGTTDANGTLAPVSTDRGYTEHEQMDEVGLINMNGRIYDPAISRFLSPDPNVPAPEYMQDYNRYSYVVNNPLKLFDPTGYEECGASFNFDSYIGGSFSIASSYSSFSSSLFYNNGTSSAFLPSFDLSMPTFGLGAAPLIQNTYGDVENYSFMQPTPRSSATARGEDIRGINRSFDKAFARGDSSEMRDLLGSYQDITGGDPSSAMNVVRMSGAIVKVELSAGESPSQATLAAAATASFSMGMSGSGSGFSAAKGTSEAVSALRGAQLKEYYRQFEKYGEAGARELQNGRFRFYGELTPARTPGEMAGARLVREWNPATGATRTWYETLGQTGTVRSVAPKPVTEPLNHRIFNEAGNYMGRR